ncbi:MAG: Uma2 family endonuclease [Microcystis aeruginosa Ma_AC_P_19900807_S299]|nr:MAG: Uma2 family endonuclease [Microcystis aeruginosa Ma_AC_P_19900807_S299]
MIALSNYHNLTPEEYLQFEEKSPIKHEYIDGQIYAMAGTTDTHNIVSGNIYTIIRNHLRGSDCRVYFADVKVRLEKRNHFYSATYKSFPKLIIEVLSDSTEAFDRGDKFNDYQTLESLEEYVLVNSKHQRVETFRRGEQGLWILQTYQQESFSLQSINLTASFRDLYEDVTLETVNDTPEIPEKP